MPGLSPAAPGMVSSTIAKALKSLISAVLMEGFGAEVHDNSLFADLPALAVSAAMA